MTIELALSEFKDNIVILLIKVQCFGHKTNLVVVIQNLIWWKVWKEFCCKHCMLSMHTQSNKFWELYKLANLINNKGNKLFRMSKPSLDLNILFSKTYVCRVRPFYWRCISKVPRMKSFWRTWMFYVISSSFLVSHVSFLCLNVFMH